MKQVTWTGGPGHVFNAENVTLGPGESRVFADELADRLRTADEHAPNPGQLVVCEIAEPEPSVTSEAEPLTVNLYLDGEKIGEVSTEPEPAPKSKRAAKPKGTPAE